jgi:hypothetical protein
MVSNLARMEGGKNAVHQLSSPYPKYSQNETDRKIGYALKASTGPISCRYIQEVLGFTGCPSGGCGVKAPAGLGVSRRAVTALVAKERLNTMDEKAREALRRLYEEVA